MVGGIGRGVGAGEEAGKCAGVEEKSYADATGVMRGLLLEALYPCASIVIDH